MTALADSAGAQGWVQVLGRVAIHEDGSENRLTGSGQRLLAVLVAAGRTGATAERIAEEIWSDGQPDPWRPALRMAVARLRKQLPADWDVQSTGGAYRITTASGWIDAWRLEDLAGSRTSIGESDLEWILAGTPYGELDLLELVGGSLQTLKMQQVTLTERFCAQQPSSLTATSCTLLTGLMREHAYNDRLALLIAETLAAADRRTEALLALNAFADDYAADFDIVPEDITRFLAERGNDTHTDRRPSNVAVAAPRNDLAKELRHLLELPLLGRSDELAQLRQADGALVTGPAGCGKSRLLAEFIITDTATETTYVVGDDRLDLGLGPFAVAMPTLRDELLQAAEPNEGDDRDEGTAERAVSTRAWRIVLAHLEARSIVQPQRLVVDDAHLLDPASLGLLRLLIRSNTAAAVSFVVSGRSDADDRAWLDLVRDAERAGLEPISLSGLTASDFEEMVYQHFPSATHAARRGLALDVYEASGGLPAVAAPLVAAADPKSLALPEQVGGASALARITATLSEGALEVVSAAVVLGYQFSIGALIALTELDEPAVFRTLDELWTRGIVVETDDPDQVRFQHVLMQRALLDGIPLFRRGQLHRRAAEITHDVHDRADHQANASALIPADVAAESLRESARVYADARNWRNVARQVRRIDQLPGDYVDVDSRILWAIALDRSGADGTEQRREAYRVAVEDGDWERALEAAIAGLPHAELPDGDPERIEMLEALDPGRLHDSARFERAYHLARQYSLVGDDGSNVLRYADEALDIADDADQKGLAHVLRWMATRHVSYEAHDIPLSVINQGSPHIRMRVAQVNAISLAERGDFDAARSEGDRFRELAISLGDPLRIWHAQAFRSMFLMNSGDFAAAELAAEENRRFAELHDLQQGTAAYLGQLVHFYDCQDRLAELWSVLEPFKSDLDRVVLGRAGLLVAGHAAGKPGIETDLREVFLEARSRPASSLSLLAAVLLTRHLPEYAPDLVNQTRAYLERFGDRPILAGFGGGNFGPTSIYVAQLTADPVERGAVVDRAIHAADRQGALLWRVRARLDKADLGDRQALEEAWLLAGNTQLQAVVRRRAEALESSDGRT